MLKMNKVSTKNEQSHYNLLLATDIHFNYNVAIFIVGKTENTKYLVQHIMRLCRQSIDRDLHDKILEVSLLMSFLLL